MLNGMWRGVTAAGLALVLVVSMAACSIPVTGLVGVGRVAHGDLRVYLRSCTWVMSHVVLDVASEGQTPGALPDLLAERVPTAFRWTSRTT